MRLNEIQCKSALSKSGIPATDYCLNPYVGCAHACVYCYASFMKRFTGHAETWGSFVDLKLNVADRLTAELRRGKSGTVLLSSVTDPYQPVEATAGLTRRCLEGLSRSPLRVSVLTKSDLVVRDLDLLRASPGAEVGFTITTPDDHVSRVLEPGAPPTSRRLAALARLAAAGVRTWVFIAPAVPGISDTPEALERILRLSRSAGAADVDLDPLNFYPAAVNGLGRAISRALPHSLPAWLAAVRDRAGYRDRVLTLFRSLSAAGPG